MGNEAGKAKTDGGLTFEKEKQRGEVSERRRLEQGNEDVRRGFEELNKMGKCGLGGIIQRKTLYAGDP